MLAVPLLPYSDSQLPEPCRLAGTFSGLTKPDFRRRWLDNGEPAPPFFSDLYFRTL